jgi:hypothetical protein
MRGARDEIARRDALLKPEPCYWEIAGQLFSTKEEALKPGYIGTPEPLWDDSVFDYLSQRDALAGEVIATVCIYGRSLELKTDVKKELPDGEYKIYAAPPAPASAVPDEIIKIANHIASSKDGLPIEWVDWADEIETDLRSAAMPDTSNMLRRWLTYGKGMMDAGSTLPRHLIADTEGMLAKQPVSAAIRDVIAERQRELSLAEDGYMNGALALGGAAYAISGAGFNRVGTFKRRARNLWPWPKDSFEPSGDIDCRHDLIRGAAMIVAEIEKYDRANGDKG